MQPPELVEHWQERAPMLRPQLVPDVNHYTLLFDSAAVAVVIEAITGLPVQPRPILIAIPWIYATWPQRA